MKTVIVTWSILLSTVWLLAQNTFTSEIQTKVDEYLSYIEDKNQDIGTISILENGEEVYNRQFGQKYLSPKPKTPKHLGYGIGSTTKLFTAVMLWQLEEQGKISLEEPLSNYFPDVDNADKIKLKYMFNHTSGLSRNYEFVSLNEQSIKPQKPKKVLCAVEKEKSVFEPTTDTLYSNTAFYLLSRILEQKYDKPYHIILQEQIVQPLGLKNLEAVDQKNNNKYYQKGYVKDGDTWKEAERELSLVNASGVGDITADVKDVAIFMHSLFNGKILKKSTLEKILPKDEKGFGYGVYANKFKNDNWLYGHGGDLFHTHTRSLHHPKRNITVSCSVNGENYPTTKLNKDIWNIILGIPSEFPNFDVFDADKSWYKKYAGTYTSKEAPLEIKIFEEEGKLMAQAAGQGAFELIPNAEHKFVFLPANITVVFNPKKETFDFKQHAVKYAFSKKKASDTVVKSIKVDKKTLKSYVGTYSSKKLPFDVKIRTKDGILKAKADGQPEFDLTATAKDTFTFAPAGVVIVFRSKKKEFTLKQGGQDFLFTKK